MILSRSSVEVSVDDGIDTLLRGQSPAMQSIRARVLRAAPTTTSILVTGPSGSGKERVARAIHQASIRKDGPFVAINCGAIPRDLLESELFGHEKGSFTGAHASRQGRFEEANHGTLFLDEIGDMPADMQVKLLRVLEERRVERVGGRGSIPVDVRIVSATHRNLMEAIDQQRFREDLFYRLAVFPIDLPSLAERVEDLGMLIQHFLATLADSKTTVRFSRSAMAVLESHAWPGNVRELRNLVERAAILHPGETLDAVETDALLLRPRSAASTAAAPARPVAPLLAMPQPEEPASMLPEAGIDLRAVLAQTEQNYIREALKRTDGVIAQAARLLGLNRTTLIERMRRYA